MSFLNNLVNQFAHQGQGGGQQQGGGYGQSQGGYSQQEFQYQQNSSYGGGNQGPPQCPPPWFAEWDNYQNRWIFINRETGQRTHEFPGQGGYGHENRGYQQQQSYGGGGYQQQTYGSQPPQQKSHTGRNVALGAAAGLAGGALLMHEGHKVEEHFEEDKYRAEERFDEDRARVDYDVDRADGYVDRKVYDGVQDVENFPDNAARWTGDKVQEVEDIPYDVDRKWDNFKNDVEDIPDDVAYRVGDGVGDVERFGDNIDNAYDAGRDERRYDDDRW